jgi:hypothetical protein
MTAEDDGFAEELWASWQAEERGVVLRPVFAEGDSCFVRNPD